VNLVKSDPIFDKLVSDVAVLDPRLRVAADDPDCFLCGKRVRRAVAVTVETGASIGMHAHAECVGNSTPFDLCVRYWQAIRAAVSGKRESPNPCAPRVRGAFR